jgi:hypothetical protein
MILVLVFFLFSSNPPLVLTAAALIYASSGPVITLLTLRKHKASRKPVEEEVVNLKNDDTEQNRDQAEK